MRYLNPWYWIARRDMKRLVALLEANPWLMESPNVRRRLDSLVWTSKMLGWTA